MKHNKTGTIFQKRLILLAGIAMLILSVQVCSGFTNAYQYTLELMVSPSSVNVGSPATITINANDPYHLDVFFANAQGSLLIKYPSGMMLSQSFTTDATGKFTSTFSPPDPGTYELYATSKYNYNNFGGIFASNNVGVQSATSVTRTLTAKQVLTISKSGMQQVVSINPAVSTTQQINQPITLHIVQPVTQPVTITQVVTTQGPQPSTDQVVTTPPVTQTQTSSNPQTSVSDSIPPVTTLTISGISDGSGGYTSDVSSTLTAVDNDGGSGVNLIQYSFDGTSWFTYSQPFSVVKQGMTTVYYRSADNAGNTEVAKVKAIIINGPGSSSTGSQSQPGTVTAAPTLPANATAKNSIPWVSGELTICTILAATAIFMYKKAAR